ncbi:MAG: hypothetical protein GF331_26350, partial [Chitinivibrionales bacterium]|nr:hypothetical protein [Chitinivibrionales bacterium]
MRKRSQTLGSSFLIVVLLSLGALPRDLDKDFYANIIRLDNCATKIQTGYVPGISSEELVNAALAGMFAALDGNSGLIVDEAEDTARNEEMETTEAISARYFTATLPQDVAYLWFHSIDEEARKQAEVFLERKRKQGLKAVAVDLRDCAGGLLNECVAVAGFFLPRGSKVVTTEGKLREQDMTLKTPGKPLLPDSIPVAVIINGRTASGGELIAAALQHYDRGVLIGDTTAASGKVTSLIRIDKSNILRLTTALFYS